MAFLLIFIFFIVLLFAILPDLIPGVSNKLVQYVKEQEDEGKLRAELKNLREHLSTISMTDEFAKYAKTERKINKITEQLKQYSKSRSEVYVKVKLGANVAFHVLQFMCFILLIINYRHVPLIELPADWFYPISSFVAFPSGVPGGIGITCWLLVCRNIVRKGIDFVKSTAKESVNLARDTA